MGDVQTTRGTSIDRFWDRFIDLARKNDVKDTAVPWYVRHAERDLRALSGKRLAEHTSADVAGDLESVGRIGGIEDWQFRQIVDAVQMLLSTANADVVGEVDWAYWRDSARTLALDHPTIAREMPARAGASADQEPVSGARFKDGGVKPCRDALRYYGCETALLAFGLAPRPPGAFRKLTG